MREFSKENRVFVKSNNSVTKIFNRYLYCLIPFVLLIVVYNLIWGSNLIIINLFKSICVSLVISLLVEYIFCLIKKDNFVNCIFKDNVLTIGIIIGLFSYNQSIIVTIIASLVSIIIRKLSKIMTVSSALFGILIILIYAYFTSDNSMPLDNLKEMMYVGDYDSIVKSYGSLLSYSLGLKYYLSPILSRIAFIYLFFKKSIKYNIVLSYILSFSLIMLVFGIFNGMNIWYLFFQLCTGDILFLTVFCLVDYKNTPIIFEGQIIYGIILGVITGILRFIIPELSVVISLVLGILLISRLIDKVSYKLKYNKKFYYMILCICLFFVIGTSIVLNLIF